MTVHYYEAQPYISPLRKQPYFPPLRKGGQGGSRGLLITLSLQEDSMNVASMSRFAPPGRSLLQIENLKFQIEN